jgi:hypothetical protein
MASSKLIHDAGELAAKKGREPAGGCDKTERGTACRRRRMEKEWKYCAKTRSRRYRSLFFKSRYFVRLKKSNQKNA